MNQIPSAKECALHGITEEIKYFVSIVGIGFNPDTSFHEYVWSAKGGNLPCFKMKEAK